MNDNESNDTGVVLGFKVWTVQTTGARAEGAEAALCPLRDWMRLILIEWLVRSVTARTGGRHRQASAGAPPADVTTPRGGAAVRLGWAARSDRIGCDW